MGLYIPAPFRETKYKLYVENCESNMPFICEFAYALIIDKAMSPDKAYEFMRKVQKWLLENGIADYEWSSKKGTEFTVYIRLSVKRDLAYIPLYLHFLHSEDLMAFKLRFDF